ncbi:MAG: carbonic anhydrase, partial [Verrucomicrobiota bacterium]
MPTLPNLIENNRRWAGQILEKDPHYFEKLSRQQSPQYLWIGCSDSRVPVNVITGLAPGEVFVHHNIANMVVNSDLNMLSVLQFAVDVLKVKHVIVCGHYGCGGIHAALDPTPHGLIDNWICHIKDVETSHASRMEALSGEARADRLCELNVIAQAENLRRTT